MARRYGDLALVAPRQAKRRLAPLALCALLGIMIVGALVQIVSVGSTGSSAVLMEAWRRSGSMWRGSSVHPNGRPDEDWPIIVVVTPTYKRHTRLADITRMAQTLQQVPDLHWIVIEDALDRVPAVEKLLNRTGLDYTYMAVKTQPGYPKRGWYQRDAALAMMRADSSRVLPAGRRGLLYFGDDDNSYDLRLFFDYIANVRKIGIWAVGLVGGAIVETPQVEKGRVVGWDVHWNKKRKFATDMAGFAVALDIALKSKAVFGTSCKRGAGAPETCLLEDLGLKADDLEPFGFDVPPGQREVLVWHTKSFQGKYENERLDAHGFYAE